MDIQNQEDVKIEVQPVTEPTGDTGQFASGQGVIENQPAPDQNQAVPYERFREVNEAKKVAEQEAANLRAQFSLLQQAPVAPQPQVPSDIFAEAGLGDDDIPTVKQVRHYARTIEQRGAAIQQFSARDQFVNSKADYEEVVGTKPSAGGFVPSAHFAKVLQADPELMHELTNPITAPRIAYRAAKAFKAQQELAEARQQTNQRDINQQVNLRTNPLPASAVGGGGAVQRGSELLGLDASKPEDRARILALTERTFR